MHLEPHLNGLMQVLCHKLQGSQIPLMLERQVREHHHLQNEARLSTTRVFLDHLCSNRMSKPSLPPQLALELTARLLSRFSKPCVCQTQGFPQGSFRHLRELLFTKQVFEQIRLTLTISKAPSYIDTYIFLYSTPTSLRLQDGTEISRGSSATASEEAAALTAQIMGRSSFQSSTSELHLSLYAYRWQIGVGQIPCKGNAVADGATW